MIPLPPKVALESVVRHREVVVVRLVVAAAIVRIDVLLALVDLRSESNPVFFLHKVLVKSTDLSVFRVEFSLRACTALF
jgi:hypothetical protein